VNIYYICAKTGKLSIGQIANAMELDVRELTDYINTPSPNGAATPSRVRERTEKNARKKNNARNNKNTKNKTSWSADGSSAIQTQ
jgi:hypothetical protein